MKLSTLLASTALLSAFAAGCAVDQSAPQSDAAETQTHEAADELTRAGVKGIYVRSAHFAACNVASKLELLANGTFKAQLNYSGPNVRCASPAQTELAGRYSVNSTSKVTFSANGSTTTFSLRLASGAFSGVAGTSAHRKNFEGSFRKLRAGECLDDAGCSAGQTCEAPLYIMVEGFVPPPVEVGSCVAPAPSGPKCGGFAGLVCPADTYCDDSARDPRTADQMFDCKPIVWACTMEYAPVCGTNGVTYGNSCLAGLQNAAIAHPGECKAPSPRRCGGVAGLLCPSTMECRMPKPSHPDAMGTCEPIRFN